MDLDLEFFRNFKPHYTIQPVEATRQKQLHIWRQMLVEWHHENNRTTLSLNECELFENKAINRRVKTEDRYVIGEALVQSGHGEWLDSSRTSLRIMWRTAADWGNIMHKFAEENMLIGTVYTIYELHSGDLSQGTEFHGLDATTCLRALEHLAQAGKAQIFSGAETLDETGFKFLRPGV